MKTSPLLVATRAATVAGDLIHQAYVTRPELDVKQKGRNDFVTKIDQQAENAILELLRKHFPTHGLLAEESGSSGVRGEKGPRWIIDPLDGTANFISGIGHFCVSIAFEDEQGLAVAAIYDPVRKELYAAERGKGTWVNGARRYVRQPAKLAEAMLLAGFPFRRPEHQARVGGRLLQLAGASQGLRLTGSAALDLAFVAAGKADGVVAGTLAPWDVAAGLLLIAEAGGVTLTDTGEPDCMSTGSVVGGHQKTVNAMLDILKKS
jgi:myo-inositol-1(or 4)-monophosphatase